MQHLTIEQPHSYPQRGPGFFEAGSQQHQRQRQRQRQHAQSQRSAVQARPGPPGPLGPPNWALTVSPRPLIGHRGWANDSQFFPLNDQWGTLIKADKATATPLFASLLNTMFDLVLPSDPTNSAELMTPTRLAAIYDALELPLCHNLPYLLYRAGNRLGDTDPHFRAAKGMAILWYRLGYEFGETPTTMKLMVAGLTRNGFIEMMVRDAVMHPTDRSSRFTVMIERNRSRLEGQGMTFPKTPIHPRCFMPRGVPHTGDAALLMEHNAIQYKWEVHIKDKWNGGDLWEGVPELWDKKVVTARVMNGFSEPPATGSKRMVSPTGGVVLPTPSTDKLGLTDTHHPLAGGYAHMMPDACRPALAVELEFLPKAPGWGR